MSNERNPQSGSRDEKANQSDKPKTPERQTPVARPDSEQSKSQKQGAEVPGRTTRETNSDTKKAYGPGGGSVEDASNPDQNSPAARKAGSTTPDDGGTGGVSKPQDTVPR